MKTPLGPLTLADIEDSIYAIKAYQHDNTRHPGLSVRQRWHRLSNTLAKLAWARDELLAEPRGRYVARALSGNRPTTYGVKKETRP